VHTQRRPRTVAGSQPQREAASAHKSVGVFFSPLNPDRAADGGVVREIPLHFKDPIETPIAILMTLLKSLLIFQGPY
jgi:hypothetical protein